MHMLGMPCYRQPEDVLESPCFDLSLSCHLLPLLRDLLPWARFSNTNQTVEVTLQPPTVLGSCSLSLYLPALITQGSEPHNQEQALGPRAHQGCSNEPVLSLLIPCHQLLPAEITIKACAHSVSSSATGLTLVSPNLYDMT